MGKTESGAIWLSAERTSPYQFYQYWVNVADEDAAKSLRFLSELSEDEVEQLDKQREEAAHQRDSQKRLAEEVTRIVHGEDGLSSAIKATEIFFGAEINDFSDNELNGIFGDGVPSAEVKRADLQGDGLSLLEAFIMTGLSKSKGEARRTLGQGGAYVNNRRIEDANYTLTPDDLASESIIVLRSGKKKYAILKVVD